MTNGIVNAQQVSQVGQQLTVGWRKEPTNIWRCSLLFKSLVGPIRCHTRQKRNTYITTHTRKVQTMRANSEIIPGENEQDIGPQHEAESIWNISDTNKSHGIGVIRHSSLLHKLFPKNWRYRFPHNTDSKQVSFPGRAEQTREFSVAEEQNISLDNRAQKFFW